MTRAIVLLSMASALFAGCTAAPPRASRASTASPIAIVVLTSSGCGQTESAVEQVESVATRLAIPIRFERIVVETPEEACRLHMLGSPTFLIDGRDLDPSARDRTDFGFS